MGVTAENLAEQYKLTREEVDAFSLRFVTRNANIRVSINPARSENPPARLV
jgi:hypothetical protein